MPGVALCAIGRIDQDGAWVGLSADDGTYRLAFGRPGGRVEVVDASPMELLAVAMAYFEDALDDPPPDLDATQGDMAQLCRWLRAREPDAAAAALLGQAIDAIDDGLAVDVTVSRLGDVLRALTRNEQVEAVDLLVRRYRALKD
jgi:hypothetical protein